MKNSEDYTALPAFLDVGINRHTTLSFSQIEKIVGFSLPEKSKKDHGWWRPSHPTSGMARTLREAGYAVSVSMIKEAVTFSQKE